MSQKRFLHLLCATTLSSGVVQWFQLVHKGSPQAVKCFRRSIKPTTELISTKMPPLNPKWSNLPVGSNKPSGSGQWWLLQQQNSVKTKHHSINWTNSEETDCQWRCKTLAPMHVSKGKHRGGVAISHRKNGGMNTKRTMQLLCLTTIQWNQQNWNWEKLTFHIFSLVGSVKSNWKHKCFPIHSHFWTWAITLMVLFTVGC